MTKTEMTITTIRSTLKIKRENFIPEHFLRKALWNSCSFIFYSLISTKWCLKKLMKLHLVSSARSLPLQSEAMRHAFAINSMPLSGPYTSQN